MKNHRLHKAELESARKKALGLALDMTIMNKAEDMSQSTGLTTDFCVGIILHQLKREMQTEMTHGPACGEA